MTVIFYETMKDCKSTPYLLYSYRRVVVRTQIKINFVRVGSSPSVKPQASFIFELQLEFIYFVWRIENTSAVNMCINIEWVDGRCILKTPIFYRRKLKHEKSDEHRLPVPFVLSTLNWILIGSWGICSSSISAVPPSFSS